MSKAQIFDRDNGKCFYCGRQLTMAEATEEHVVPTSMGGPKNNHNAVIACEPCNQEVDAKPVVEKIVIRDRNLGRNSAGTKTTIVTVGEVKIETTEVRL